MSKWDDELHGKPRKINEKLEIDSIFKYSIVFSIGTLFGMALVYYLG